MLANRNTQHVYSDSIAKLHCDTRVLKCIWGANFWFYEKETCFVDISSSVLSCPFPLYMSMCRFVSLCVWDRVFAPSCLQLMIYLPQAPEHRDYRIHNFQVLVNNFHSHNHSWFFSVISLIIITFFTSFLFGNLIFYVTEKYLHTSISTSSVIRKIPLLYSLSICI